ncbi:MAG TPA: LPS assembly lipoprotein LptE [Usitatibacter sp.]|nr:LPS assembly lipoprotein LptE [Usitatibacter sp.]
MSDRSFIPDEPALESIGRGAGIQGWVPAFAGTTSWVIAAALALLLAGCGFELRGEPTVGLRTLYVATNVPSSVAGDIRRILATGRTRLVPTEAGAEASLRILAETREKTVHTITGSGRVYDFQLRLAVSYQLTVPGREEPVIAPGEVSTMRLITYSEAAPTAKEAEEQLLYKDMQADLAGRILRQVAVARRESAGAFPARP